MWNLLALFIFAIYFIDISLSAAVADAKLEKAKNLFKGVLKSDQVEKIAARLQKLRSLQNGPAPMTPMNKNSAIRTLGFKSSPSLDALEPTPSEINRDQGLEDVLYAGDLLLTEKQLDQLIAEAEMENRGNDENEREKRQAVAGYWHIFDKTKPIFYTFEPDYANPVYRDLFREAMEYWNAYTCLNITEGTGEQLIRVISGSTCWSNLGNINSTTGQHLSIGAGCERFDTILHEMGHALGFHHTQNRHDRDNYIRITINSSYPTFSQFTKESEANNNNFGLPYDLGSIMHYESRPPNGPMEAVDKTKQYVVGARDKVAFSDFKMMNVLYNCQESCPSGPVCQHEGYRNPKNCNVCVCPRGFQGSDCSQPQFTKDTNETCGGMLTAQSYLQTINSSIDSFSTAFLRNIATCYWHIQAPEGKTVRVRFNAYNGTQPLAKQDLFAPCYAFGLEVRTDNFTTIGARVCRADMVDPLYEYKSKSNYAIVAGLTKYFAVNFSFSYWYVDQNNCEMKDEL